ncbi:LysM peptidoglycan-binding domain-containing protein [Sporolactobacillus sp. CPB3-1]|uniref:LysM peptidoglycan-binding domain-containing protein n=1 Tax=Sporolactobacillus mangiferae TaxID=2940498 RepID=A0ABT0MAA1_9BACL|nr:LysM peptidoglycan-binding domain-containing protein [Sporolactobacillus mangiferae]MCL1631801.1 LysM peptidoglycan-binding domain-containing protein [Sporolactobacillus mangiferae]
MQTHTNKKARGISYIVLLCIMTIIFFFTLSNTVLADQNSYEKIKVKAGDSLWSIAEAHQKESANLSKHAFIEWVKNENGLTRDHIIPNQQLVIPVKRK